MKTATLVARCKSDMITHPGRPLLIRWVIKLHGRRQRVVEAVAVVDRDLSMEQLPSMKIGTELRFARRLDSGSTKQRTSRAVIVEDLTESPEKYRVRTMEDRRE